MHGRVVAATVVKKKNHKNVERTKERKVFFGVFPKYKKKDTRVHNERNLLFFFILQ